MLSSELQLEDFDLFCLNVGFVIILSGRVVFRQAILPLPRAEFLKVELGGQLASREGPTSEQ